jgi:DNA-binding beta-propeller fold protein YncE
MNLLKEKYHFEPLRPQRSMGVTAEGKYEFTHGKESVCVYDIKTLDFVKEIPVGTNPDCHATSADNKYLYIACFEGLYCIDQESLEVVKILDTGRLYATNALPDGNTLLVHDLTGGVIIIKDICDMEKIHIHKRIQVIPDGKFRCEIGGKGNFINNGRYYLCCGWLQSKLYLFDVEDDFSFEVFIDTDPILYGSDDLVVSSDEKTAYCACHRGKYGMAHVAVIDIENKKIIKTIPTGYGTCGLTMTPDERYVAASNDQDDSITVIDTTINEVVNTPCAREAFDALGITGYIQGISGACDGSIFVYGCEGNGAIVKFEDIAKSNKFTVSWKGGKYTSD